MLSSFALRMRIESVCTTSRLSVHKREAVGPRKELARTVTLEAGLSNSQSSPGYLEARNIVPDQGCAKLGQSKPAGILSPCELSHGGVIHSWIPTCSAVG
jgi:hypothetical protein